MIKRFMCISALLLTPTIALANGGNSIENEKNNDLVVQKENVVVKKEKGDTSGKESYQSTSSIFEAKKGERLSSVIKRWAESEGWSVHWAYSDDYILPVDVSIKGDLKSTLELVSRSLTDSRIDVNIKMYTLNKAVVIR